MFSFARSFTKDSLWTAWKSICTYSTNMPSETKTVSKLVESCGGGLGDLFGQPTPATHPHLLSPGEVVPGIQKEEFIERRITFISRLLQSTPKLQSNHIVIIPSATKVYMSEKIPYVFRQNTDFLYLTGCLEPDSALVITASHVDNAVATLFMRRKDKHAEKWDGPRTGVEGALQLFGVEQALPFSELKRFITSYSQSCDSLVLWYDFSSCIHPEVHSVLGSFTKVDSLKAVESPKPILHQQRLIKSAAEQQLMVRTCRIASDAMTRTMAFTRPGVTEHQLFTKMDSECRMLGAEFLAYPPVVAAGNNANIIHYIANQQKTDAGQMVLMDAGCSVSGYCSDLSRTWPVGGQFSQAQLILYQMVLDTQQQLITLCHPEHSLDHIFNTMCQILGHKLIEAGIFKTGNKDYPSKLAYDLCPHHASHYLGMDVHDTSTVSRNLKMRPGMVITVEPGLYITKNNELVHEEFRGQGLRVEDNLLITNSTPLVLTNTCPKDPKDIQKFVGSLYCN